MKLISLLPLLPLVLATPLERRQASGSSSAAAAAASTARSATSSSAAASSATPTASSRAASGSAGFSTFNTFPASGVAATDTANFPNESQVGIPGPTPTGVEPQLVTYPSAYPYKYNAFPLIAGAPSGSGQTPLGSESLTSSNFNILRYFGNLSPWRSNTDASWAIKTASPDIPNNCSITQVHILYRHGARYPTTGSAPASFAVKVQNATKAGGFSASGDLAFLNNWQYKLGAELLTPFGRLQNFELGVGFRQLYGSLLNNFTAQGTIPVFRTESQDRMVKTALNFAAGFFGVPEYTQQVNLLVEPETPGVNNTGASYETCTNSNNARGSYGTAAAANFTTAFFQSTASRIQSLVQGINITSTDIPGMMQLCAYETVALGASPFCKLFTEDEFKAFEYSFDLSFYYNQGLGSSVGAAQGIGWVQELVSRLTQTQLTESTKGTNQTIQNPTQMPLNQSIYADATHEVIVLDVLTALNLTSIGSSGPLPVNSQPSSQSFVASQIVPFGTHLVIQVLECSTSSPTKQIRFIHNDGVVPLTYAGCSSDPNGLCAYDTVVKALQQRIAEVNYNYDCFANYTVPTAGQDLNGRAPANSSTAAPSSPASASATVTTLASSMASAGSASASFKPAASVSTA